MKRLRLLITFKTKQKANLAKTTQKYSQPARLTINYPQKN